MSEFPISQPYTQFLAEAVEHYNETHGPAPDAPLSILIQEDGTVLYTENLAESLRRASSGTLVIESPEGG